MFSKSLKKRLAVLLTGVMVLGMTVTAFAGETSGNGGSNGTGNFEGHVNRDIVEVVLPTVPDGTTPFSFVYDPEGLIPATSAAAYGEGYGSAFEGGKYVWFKTGDKQFKDTSTEFTVSNNSAVSVNVVLQLDVVEKAGQATLSENLPADYSDTNKKSGDPCIKLELITGGTAQAVTGYDTTGTHVVSTNSVTKSFAVAGKPDNYEVSANQVYGETYPHEYTFKKKAGATGFDTITFKLKATANKVLNAKGVTAPDLKVTWKYDPIGDIETDEQGGGDTPAGDVAPSIATTTYTYTSGQALDIPVSLGSGTLKATGINRITYVNSSGVSTALTTDKWSYANGKITIAESYITALAGASVTRDYKVTFENSASTQVVITLKP